MATDITGQRFGKLTAINKAIRANTKNSYYYCKCDCGNELEIARTSLVSGRTTSCGCIKQRLWQNETRHKAGFVDNTCVTALKSKLSKSNTSGTKGVTWDKARLKWLAQIGFKGKVYNLGRYENIEDAVRARQTAEEEMHGEFLRWYEREYKRTGK